MKKTLAKELLQFIEKSPSTYHVMENVRARLLASGYTELEENARWSLAHGGKYFLTRGGTSCIAFRVPEQTAHGFMLTASHSDSPSFKIKENPERTAAGHYLQLSTEKYGGMLMAPWFDRPLSVAGHVLVDTEDGIETRLVNIDRDLLVIPSLPYEPRGKRRGQAAGKYRYAAAAGLDQPSRLLLKARRRSCRLPPGADSGA